MPPPRFRSRNLDSFMDEKSRNKIVSLFGLHCHRRSKIFSEFFSRFFLFFFFYELFDSFFGLERYSDIKNLKGALQVRDFNILICLIDLMWLWKLCWSSNSLFFNLKLSIFFDSIFEQWRISIIISFIIYSIFYFRFKFVISLWYRFIVIFIHSMIQLLFTRYIDSTRVAS